MDNDYKMLHDCVLFSYVEIKFLCMYFVYYQYFMKTGFLEWLLSIDVKLTLTELLYITLIEHTPQIRIHNTSTYHRVEIYTRLLVIETPVVFAWLTV